VDLTFGWFGETFRVGPDAGDLSLLAFLDDAELIDANDEGDRGRRRTMEFLREQVHPDDWTRVMELARANHLHFLDLMALGKSIVAGVARFHSGRPSDSSDGLPSTPPKSRDAYSLAVEDALAQAAGRPDIKMVIFQAHQARKQHQPV